MARINKDKSLVLISIIFILSFALISVWAVPGLLASELPMTPPWTGTKCENEYEIHFEFTNEAWCSEDVTVCDSSGCYSSPTSCNGAVCKHLWKSIDFDRNPFSVNFHPVSLCYCK